MPLKFFNKIPAIVDEKKIYKRLGYYKKKTKVSTAQRKKIDIYRIEALRLLSLKGVATRLSILTKSYPKVVIEEGVLFESKLFFSLVKDCQEVLFMGVTAGKRISKKIAKLQDIDFVRSVVYDAVASEYVDACFDWISNYFSQELIRENKILTPKRISCGYFDFSLEYQKLIFKILKLKKLGLSLTKKYMLVPEKSATAVMGIKKMPNFASTLK